MPVSAVAYECGYNSLRSFNRCFRRITGRTPREYREEKKKEGAGVPDSGDPGTDLKK